MTDIINYKLIDQHLTHLFNVGRPKVGASIHRYFCDIISRFDDPMVESFGTDWLFWDSDTNGYSRQTYETIWGGGKEDSPRLPDSPFKQLPHVHKAGYLVNRTKRCYIDLADYVKVATFSPTWDKGRKWCVNPLPILTCIGNGRGGGDYYGTNMDKVGSWAMDEIEYTLDSAKLEGITELDASDYSFIEG